MEKLHAIRITTIRNPYNEDECFHGFYPIMGTGNKYDNVYGKSVYTFTPGKGPKAPWEILRDVNSVISKKRKIISFEDLLRVLKK